MRPRCDFVAAVLVIGASAAGKFYGCGGGGDVSGAVGSGGGAGTGNSGGAGNAAAGKSGSAGNAPAGKSGAGAAGTAGQPAGAGGGGQAGAAGESGKPADDVAGWESFLQVRPGCVLRRPKAPLDDLVPALVWKACSGAPCQQLETTWSSVEKGSFAVRTVAAQPQAQGGDASWMTMVQVYEQHPSVFVTPAFDLSTGKPMFAWASECLLRLSSSTNELFLGYGSIASGLKLLWGPPATLEEEPRAQLPFAIMNNLTLGGKYVAWDTATLSMMPRDTGVPFSVKYDVPGGSTFHEFVGDDAYFAAEEPKFLRTWVRRNDGGTEELLAQPGANVGSFSSDGKTMAWMVFSEQKMNAQGSMVSETIELFASPHANTKAAVVPSRLGRLSYLENKPLGLGWKVRKGVLSYEGGRPLTFFRLADGWFKTLPDSPPIPGTTWGELVWADDHEVIVVVLEGIQGKTILRYKLDDLAPWQPLPQ